MRKSITNLALKAVLMLLLCTFLFMPVKSFSANNKATIELNKKSLTLESGKTYTFRVTLSGGSGSIKWSTSNKNIAIVKNGTVTAKKTGTATIKAEYSGTTVQCKVTVTDPNKKK